MPSQWESTRNQLKQNPLTKRGKIGVVVSKSFSENNITCLNWESAHRTTCHIHYLHIITFSAHLHSHSFSVYLHSHSFSINSHLRTKSTHLNCPNCLLRHILTLTLSQQIYTLILAENEWLKKRRKFILASAPFPLEKFYPWYTLYTLHLKFWVAPPSPALHWVAILVVLKPNFLNNR